METSKHSSKYFQFMYEIFLKKGPDNPTEGGKKNTEEPTMIENCLFARAFPKHFTGSINPIVAGSMELTT